MATFAMGDIQGCWRTLSALLERIRYHRRSHVLWLAGDLVNRGPSSLEVVRWAKNQGSSVVAVLGNHDLHLIGVALGLRPPKKGDTLQAFLEAPDRADLIEWLLHRPLLRVQGRHVLVHAGIPPLWSVDLARELAAEAEAVLRRDPRRAIRAYADDGVRRWDGKGPKRERLSQALRGFTLLRTVRPDGDPCDRFTGPPAVAPSGCRPWFEMRQDREVVVCGHWAALGLVVSPKLLALDTGCVWGGALTAVRLRGAAVFQQPSVER